MQMLTLGHFFRHFACLLSEFLKVILLLQPFSYCINMWCILHVEDRTFADTPENLHLFHSLLLVRYVFTLPNQRQHAV